MEMKTVFLVVIIGLAFEVRGQQNDFLNKIQAGIQKFTSGSGQNNQQAQTTQGSGFNFMETMDSIKSAGKLLNIGQSQNNQETQTQKNTLNNVFETMDSVRSVSKLLNIGQNTQQAETTPKGFNFVETLDSIKSAGKLFNIGQKNLPPDTVSTAVTPATVLASVPSATTQKSSNFNFMEAVEKYGPVLNTLVNEAKKIQLPKSNGASA